MLSSVCQDFSNIFPCSATIKLSSSRLTYARGLYKAFIDAIYWIRRIFFDPKVHHLSHPELPEDYFFVQNLFVIGHKNEDGRSLIRRPEKIERAKIFFMVFCWWPQEPPDGATTFAPKAFVLSGNMSLTVGYNNSFCQFAVGQLIFPPVSLEELGWEPTWELQVLLARIQMRRKFRGKLFFWVLPNGDTTCEWGIFNLLTCSF